jgi:hypothetical protein
MTDQREPWLEQHDRHVMDRVAHWMANVKNQEAHPRASLPMNSLPKCSRYGEAEARGEGAKAGSFEAAFPRPRHARERPAIAFFGVFGRVGQPAARPVPRSRPPVPIGCTRSSTTATGCRSGVEAADYPTGAPGSFEQKTFLSTETPVAALK